MKDILSAMNSLQHLDAELSKLRQAFIDVARDVSFRSICSLASEETVAQQRYPGIYLIEISTAGVHRDLSSWYAAFQAGWEHPNFKEKFTPNTRKNRISAHSSLAEWMPLYIGKSRIVSSRVGQHINLDLKARTFALKLRSRPGLMLRNLRLSTISLENVAKENYDLVAPAVEQAMRNKLNPIVGKQ